MMTLREILLGFRARLRDDFSASEIDSLEMAVLEHELGYSRVDAILRAPSELPEFVAEKFESIAVRLLRHEPIQYILGDAYFCGHHFKVTPATLIPRPETEGLVDLIVDENQRPDLRVLDIGTGSGCIAISLARALRFAQVAAIDVSREALEVARENAARLKARVELAQADILAMPLPREPLYDIVVSNPPYIAQSEQPAMEANVLDYEPHSALFVPDDDPLRFYTAITRYASAALQPGGRLYFEINSRFAAQVRQLMADSGFSDTQVLSDYRGQPRMAKGEKM